VHRGRCTHHEQRPDGVVDEDGGRCDEHAKAYEAVELPLSAVDRLFLSWAKHTILALWV
jgi:hypothetical protein